MLRVIITLLLVVALQAQQAVNQVAGSPPVGVQAILSYSSNSVQYICYTRSAISSSRTITVSAASNASPVALTATAHGFDYQSLATTTPLVQITGGTGNWVAVNGVWVGTPTSANALTIAVDSSGFGALTGTLVIKTFAPSAAAEIWAIQKFVYDASGNMIWSGWGGIAGGLSSRDLKAGSSAYNLACSSRTTYGYQ